MNCNLFIKGLFNFFHRPTNKVSFDSIIFFFYHLQHHGMQYFMTNDYDSTLQCERSTDTDSRGGDTID